MLQCADRKMQVGAAATAKHEAGMAHRHFPKGAILARRSSAPYECQADCGGRQGGCNAVTAAARKQHGLHLKGPPLDHPSSSRQAHQHICMQRPRLRCLTRSSGQRCITAAVVRSDR